MTARDTSLKAAQIQEDVHQSLSPADRLRMTIEMSEFARSLSKAGLRTRRPELTDAELDDLMLEQLYGFRRTRE
jgi:hypothetical protein